MVKIDDFEIIGSEYERIQRLTDKGFISNGELNTKFYAVYKMYSDYFLDFIDDTIKLKSYDDALSEKKLLPKIEEEYMDVYQRFSKYEYFYIRNYLAIEKLDDDYIEELLSRYENNDRSYDEFARSMIEKTYIEVCNNDTLFGNVSYGPDTGEFFAPNDSIVIGCRADLSIDEENDDFYEWLSREEEFVEVVEKVNEIGNGKFDCPFNAFYYEDDDILPIEDFDFVDSKKKVR